MYKYSKSTNGFYFSALHSDIPDDAVEIADALYNEVCANRPANKVLASDESGYPILIDPPEVSAPPKQFTSLGYLDLFTDAEQLAVATATMENASVKLWYDRMLAASFITLADPRTEAGLSALVTAGLITATRKKKIIEAMQ